MIGIEKFAESVLLEMISEIERKNMPQVKGKDVDEVLKIFDDHNIKYEQGNAKCEDLKPTQEDFIPEKLESLKKKIQEEDWVTHPLFVSKEGNILDGHHRWLAYKEIYGNDFQIPVTKVDLPLEKALKVFSAGASKVSESADTVYLNYNKQLSYMSPYAYPFAYVNGKMKVGTGGDTHSSMGKPRKYDGRYWENDKVMSFWYYPPKNKFKKVIKDLEKASNLKILNDPKWKIEVIRNKKTGKFLDQAKGSDWDWEVIPLSDYIGSSNPKRVPHEKSPLTKKAKVPSGTGSEKIPKDLKKGETMAQYHARKKTSENIISESADVIFLGKNFTKPIAYTDSDARGFFYDEDGTLTLTDYGKAHSSVRLRTKSKYTGRIWEKHKIISFWNYPPKSEMKKVIKTIENKTGLKMNDWKIEVIVDERTNKILKKVKNSYYEEMIIPLKDYTKSISTKHVNHEKSPLTKREKVPSGVGSKKIPSDLKKGETMAQYHARKRTSENIIESLTNPDLNDAYEFVFRDYSKLYNKWMSGGAKGNKPDIFPIFKKVVKKFNSYNTETSNFSLDELIQSYVDYRYDEIQKAKLPIMKIQYYGLDTLPTKYLGKIKKFISENIDENIDIKHPFFKSLGVEVDEDYSVRLLDINEIRGNKVIAVFPGRFQPFHINHYEAYQQLVKKFGKNNVYVATSNKVEPDKSPFNFSEKKKIMIKIFGIPSSNIIEVSAPYNNQSYKSLGDMNKDVLVVGIGEKDANRLVTSGRFYEKYTAGEKQPFGEKGYVYIVPLKTMKIGGKIIDGTILRKVFKKGSDKSKKQLFKKLYGKFDQSIYDLISGKLNESVILSSVVIEEYIVHNDVKKIISETTFAADGQVDDGPATFYETPEAYKRGRLNVKQKSMEEAANQLGWQVIDWLAGETNEYTGYKFRTNLVGDVSFGDVGVRDTDYKDPIGEYQKYMTKAALAVGYSVVDWLLGDTKKESIIDDPKKKMAKFEPLVQDTSDASEPLGEHVFSKDWWIKNLLYESLLVEGAAYGHLNHPFEDWNLTFGDLRKMIEAGLEGKLDMAQEKCLDGNSIVDLQENGKTTIKEVVDNKIQDKILSYNREEDLTEYRDIIGYANNRTTEEWLEIELENGNVIRVTPNHKIYVKDVGYVEAKDLTDDMELVII